MLRIIVVASALGSLLLACTRAPVMAPAVAHSSEPQAVAVAYRVLRTGDGTGVLLSGRTDVDTRHGFRVEATAAHTSAGEQLDFMARPREDGTVTVEIMYEETTLEGARLKWAPSVRLARGATAHAEVSGSGWGRVIEVTVE